MKLMTNFLKNLLKCLNSGVELVEHEWRTDIGLVLDDFYGANEEIVCTLIQRAERGRTQLSTKLLHCSAHFLAYRAKGIQLNLLTLGPVDDRLRALRDEVKSGFYLANVSENDRSSRSHRSS